MGDTDGTDQKTKALRQQGSLNPRPERVKDELFRQTDFFDSRDLVQVKYEMLRRVRADKQAVAQSATAFGLSRPSFYKAQEDFARDGLAGLVPKKRGPRTAHKLTDEVMQFVKEQRDQDESVSAAVLARRVEDRFGLKVHPRSIERALGRGKKNCR